MKVKSESEVAQSCLTLSDPMDCSLPGSSVHGIFQARVLEWGALGMKTLQMVINIWSAPQLVLDKIIFIRFCLEQKWKWSESASHSVESDSLRPRGLCSSWNSPGQNTAVGSLSPLQGIFPTQRSNLGLPHCRWIFYQLSQKGSPRILEWVAYPFSSEFSWPRNSISWIQENQGLLHCRQILCQLSYWGFCFKFIQLLTFQHSFCSKKN